MRAFLSHVTPSGRLAALRPPSADDHGERGPRGPGQGRPDRLEHQSASASWRGSSTFSSTFKSRDPARPVLIDVENDLGFSAHFQRPGEQQIDPGEVCALLAAILAVVCALVAGWASSLPLPAHSAVGRRRCSSQLLGGGEPCRAGVNPVRPAGVADDDALLLVAGDDLGDRSRPGAAPAVGDADRGSARVLRERADTESVEHGAPVVPELAGSPAGEGLSLRRASRSAGNSLSSAAAMPSGAQALTLTYRSSRSRARRSRSGPTPVRGYNCSRARRGLGSASSRTPFRCRFLSFTERGRPRTRRPASSSRPFTIPVRVRAAHGLPRTARAGG